MGLEASSLLIDCRRNYREKTSRVVCNYPLNIG